MQSRPYHQAMNGNKQRSMPSKYHNTPWTTLRSLTLTSLTTPSIKRPTIWYLDFASRLDIFFGFSYLGNRYMFSTVWSIIIFFKNFRRQFFFQKYPSTKITLPLPPPRLPTRVSNGRSLCSMLSLRPFVHSSTMNTVDELTMFVCYFFPLVKLPFNISW